MQFSLVPTSAVNAILTSSSRHRYPFLGIVDSAFGRIRLLTFDLVIQLIE